MLLQIETLKAVHFFNVVSNKCLSFCLKQDQIVAERLYFFIDFIHIIPTR